MSKLSKAQYKAHNECLELLKQEALSLDEKFFVIENWQESANHVNSAAGAFFTPIGLALDAAIEVGGGHVIDLCAGIGCLSFALLQHDRLNHSVSSITCIEINPAYVEVGRKIVPEANWICADIFEAAKGKFDTSISNPPFGSIKRSGLDRFRAGSFEVAMIRLASGISDYGVFIIPNSDLKDMQKFISPSCIDASFHSDGWRGVKPKVEVVTADFSSKEIIGQMTFALDGEAA